MLSNEDKKTPVVELAVPKGESADGYLERFFGTAATPHDEMPNDIDVDSTVIIKLK